MQKRKKRGKGERRKSEHNSKRLRTPPPRPLSPLRSSTSSTRMLYDATMQSAPPVHARVLKRVIPCAEAVGRSCRRRRWPTNVDTALHQLWKHVTDGLVHGVLTERAVAELVLPDGRTRSVGIVCCWVTRPCACHVQPGLTAGIPGESKTQRIMGVEVRVDGQLRNKFLVGFSLREPGTIEALYEAVEP